MNHALRKSQSTADEPGKGIFVRVPESATGRVDLRLTDVAVRGVANHGIHLSDCNLADDCGGGSGGDGSVAQKSYLHRFPLQFGRRSRRGQPNESCLAFFTLHSAFWLPDLGARQ